MPGTRSVGRCSRPHRDRDQVQTVVNLAIARPASTRSKSSVVTAATSARSSGGHGASATARAICASMMEPPWRASISRSRGPWNSPLIDTRAKPASTSSSVSSSALSSRVWNGLIGVSRPGEKVIRLGVDTISKPDGTQHPGALGHELGLVPQVLDDLEVHHDVHRRVGQRQLGQVRLHDLHPRVAAADVGHRGLVVVHRDDPAGDAGDQIGAVTFATAGLEHIAARAARRQALVDHLVAAKPVVLDVQIGDGALARQRQHRVGRCLVRRRRVTDGNECAHCIGRLTRSVGFANRGAGTCGMRAKECAVRPAMV